MIVKRNLHIIDAAGKKPGRLATQIAQILLGKHKPNFERHIDRGDYVTVIGIDRMSITSKKAKQKKYFHFSGYPGGLKTTSLETLLKKNPKEILKKAIVQMLPDNRLRKNIVKRLTFKEDDK